MLKIRILDTDASRLLKADSEVRSAIKQAGIKAKVIPVGDRLEISRYGLIADIPIVEINGRIVSMYQPVNAAEILYIIQNWQ